MKLLYITNGITGSGGLERVLSVKSDYLVRHLGYEVHILTLNEEGRQPFFLFNPKVKWHSITVKGNALSYFKNYREGIKNYVHQIEPDVISVCDDGFKGFLLPFILRKNCPLVYERHVSIHSNFKSPATGILIRLQHKIQYKIMRWAAGRFDSFVVLTKGNLQEWPLDTVKVIPNPLPFYPEKQSSLENKKIIAIGKQSFQKGYERMMASWSAIHNRHPEWEIHIYGKSDDGRALRRLAKELGIAHSFIFHEAVADIEMLLLESSILLLSSRFEGFGMVLIEAMACGLPCVAFDCPHGPADIITDKEDGFLVPNGNTDAFAEKMNMLIEDETLRKNMGKIARINAQRYLPQTVMKEWDALFKSLIK